MKIFRLNHFDWYAAESMEAAIAIAMEETGCSRADLVDEEELHELTGAELDQLKYVDHDPEGEEPEAGWPERTFREELARRVAAGEGPGIFASTEH